MGFVFVLFCFSLSGSTHVLSTALFPPCPGADGCNILQQVPVHRRIAEGSVESWNPLSNRITGAESSIILFDLMTDDSLSYQVHTTPTIWANIYFRYPINHRTRGETEHYIYNDSSLTPSQNSSVFGPERAANQIQKRLCSRQPGTISKETKRKHCKYCHQNR